MEDVRASIVLDDVQLQPVFARLTLLLVPCFCLSANKGAYMHAKLLWQAGGLTGARSMRLTPGAAQVIVVEDENGNIVRETMKDTDTLARYKTMHETLVYLSHLDHDDTEKQMLEKLRLQVSRTPAFALHRWTSLQRNVPSKSSGHAVRLHAASPK